MPRCSFCKQNYEFPRGLTLILNDGNIMYFCTKKCRLNALKLKRDNKKVNWVRKAGVNEAVESFEMAAEKNTKANTKISEKKEEKAEKKA